MSLRLIVTLLLRLYPTLCLAHSGDRLLQSPELTDEDLAQIEFHDGRVTDWQAVLGEPPLTHRDFMPPAGKALDESSFASQDGWPGILDSAMASYDCT